MKNRMHLFTMTTVAALGAVLVLASCSLPATKPAYSKGVITQKGSIFVNGVEYDTSSATIKINGVPGTEEDLKVGMHVELRGEVNEADQTGTATEVEFDNSLQGPISAMDGATKQLTVLGQTIATDGSTVYEAPLAGYADLAVSDVVEVTGIPDAGGVILATYIEKTSSTSYEIDGAVSALGSGTFTLTPPAGGNPLTVNFTGSLATGITNDVLVQVEFSTFDAGTLTITTTAGSIEPKVELEPEEGDSTDVEGFVAGLSGTTFTVDGISVDAGSLSLAGITNGTKVEVEGTFSGDVLQATSISKK